MPIETVKVLNVSDGDSTHRPTGGGYYQVSPNLYLEKIAKLWMDHQHKSKPGVKYILDRLPAGYAVFEKKRERGGHAADRWLYGNPRHKSFDSPNRFFPHFLHLMNHNGSNAGCPCSVCRPKSASSPEHLKSNPKKSKTKHHDTKRDVGNSTSKTIQPQVRDELPNASRPKPRGRPRLHDHVAVDEEGTPDIYKQLLDQLERVGEMDVPIEEPLSMDWRAERGLIPDMIENVRAKPAWNPRIGELVLFVRHIDDGLEICFNNESLAYMLWNKSTNNFEGYPTWEAGLISQPSHEPVVIEDILEESSKTQGINYSGFRVEPMPDPNSEDKALSKQYKYLPLHHIRPFVFFQEFLRGIQEDKWHPTIHHALTTASTFSLLEKYRFKGDWPHAEVFCRGIYLGPELLLEGDVVRLIPTGANAVTDFLQVSAIKVDFSGLDSPNYTTAVYICGTGWTQDPGRASHADHEQAPKPPVLAGYDDIHMMHDLKMEVKLVFYRVFGRVFETDAMLMWFPPQDPPKYDELMDELDVLNGLNDYERFPFEDTFPNPTHGLDGTHFARKYALGHDRRINKAQGKNWYWADTRTEALDLETVNGSEVRVADEGRIPKAWRKWCKLLAEDDSRAVRREEAMKKGLREPVKRISKETGALVSTTASLKRSREEYESDESKEIDASEIDDHVAQALPMDDEAIPTEDDDDDDPMEVYSTPKSHPVIVIE